MAARIVEHRPVRSLEREGSRIARVVTDDETFTPGRVVVAAGAWTAELLRQVGADVPIPYNPKLEKAAVPQEDDIVAAARRLVREQVH